MALSDIFHPYYVANILSLLLLPLLRLTPLNDYAFPGTERMFDSQETQILVFLGMVLVVKGRRVQTKDAFVGTAFMFTKLAICIILWRHNAIGLMALYILLCFVLFVAVPQPSFVGDDKILHLVPQRLKDHSTAIDGVDRYMLVQFHAVYSPECQHLSREYSELSNKYTSDNFRLAKLDVGGKYSEFAKEFAINVGLTSSQLPTLIMFKNGKPKTQRPPVNQQGTVQMKVRFNTSYIVEEFDFASIVSAGKKPNGSASEVPTDIKSKGKRPKAKAE